VETTLPGPFWLFGPFRRLSASVAAWESWQAPMWAKLRLDAIIRDAAETGANRDAYSPIHLPLAPLERCILIVKDSASSDAEREPRPWWLGCGQLG
jgi:hypothetical protein